jgi:hypothetical protein
LACCIWNKKNGKLATAEPEGFVIVPYWTEYNGAIPVFAKPRASPITIRVLCQFNSEKIVDGAVYIDIVPISLLPVRRIEQCRIELREVVEQPSTFVLKAVIFLGVFDHEWILPTFKGPDEDIMRLLIVITVFKNVTTAWVIGVKLLHIDALVTLQSGKKMDDVFEMSEGENANRHKSSLM